MIIVMRHDASAKQIAEVVARVESHGLRVNISRGEERTIIGVIGDDRPIDRTQFEPYLALTPSERLAAGIKAGRLERHSWKRGIAEGLAHATEWLRGRGNAEEWSKTDPDFMPEVVKEIRWGRR